jgi:hypothetical protein
MKIFTNYTSETSYPYVTIITNKTGIPSYLVKIRDWDHGATLRLGVGVDVESNHGLSCRQASSSAGTEVTWA